MREMDIAEAELLAADEIWVTATSIEVWPVVSVNGHTIGNGAPGLMYQKMIRLFQDMKCQAK